MYTHVSECKNGADSIRYCREGRDENGRLVGHHGNPDRNYMTFGVNMLPDEVVPFEVQMQKYWDQKSNQHIIETQRTYFSASDKELPKDDPNSPLKLAMALQEFFETYYGDRQTAVFIQHDGASGLWHGHGITNDCGFVGARGIGNSRKGDYRDKAWWIEDKFDEIFAKYVDELDYGPEQNPADKKTQYERAKDQGKTNVYSWRDDLKARIKLAMDEAADQDDFINDKLAKHGVRIVPRQNKDGKVTGIWHKSKSFGAYVTYELTDLSDFLEANNGKLPKKREYFRCKSYKLGSDYELEPPEDFENELDGERVKSVMMPIAYEDEFDDPFDVLGELDRSQQAEEVEDTEEVASVTVINDTPSNTLVVDPVIDQDDDQDNEEFFLMMLAAVDDAESEVLPRNESEELTDAQKYIKAIQEKGEAIAEIETKSILDELFTDTEGDDGKK